MTSLQELHDNFVRPLNLSWVVDQASRQRLIMASVLPAFVVVAQLIQVTLSYAFSPDELYYAAESRGAGEFWERLNRAAEVVVLTLLPLAVAVLFLAGIFRWSRSEGSWMFLAGAGLAALAALFGVLATVTYVATEDFELISDIGADVWPDIARTFGFLAVGFFFVAYRGLSAPPTETTENRQPITDNQADS